MDNHKRSQGQQRKPPYLKSTQRTRYSNLAAANAKVEFANLFRHRVLNCRGEMPGLVLVAKDFRCHLGETVFHSLCREPQMIVLLLALVSVAPAETSFERQFPVVYANRDGERLRADFYYPAGEGPFPAVIFIHGGAWRTGSRQNMVLHAEAAAKRGFVAMSITYRLSPKHKHPAQIDDCREAFRYLVKHAEEHHVQPDKIALYGYSAGAHLALLAATEPVDKTLPRPYAVVGGGSPCSFEWVGKDGVGLKYWLGKTRREAPDIYRSVSPLEHLTADDPPTFLFHGERDFLVPISGAKRFQKKATDLNIRCELYVAPGDTHIGAFFDEPSRTKSLDFLLSVLTGDDS